MEERLIIVEAKSNLGIKKHQNKRFFQVLCEILTRIRHSKTACTLNRFASKYFQNSNPNFDKIDLFLLCNSKMNNRRHLSFSLYVYVFESQLINNVVKSVEVDILIRSSLLKEKIKNNGYFYAKIDFLIFDYLKINNRRNMKFSPSSIDSKTNRHNKKFKQTSLLRIVIRIKQNDRVIQNETSDALHLSVSPNFTPYDYMFWGYVKDIVYVSLLSSIKKELKICSRQFIKMDKYCIIFQPDVVLVTKGCHAKHLLIHTIIKYNLVSLLLLTTFEFLPNRELHEVQLELLIFNGDYNKSKTARKRNTHDNTNACELCEFSQASFTIKPREDNTVGTWQPHERCHIHSSNGTIGSNDTRTKVGQTTCITAHLRWPEVRRNHQSDLRTTAYIYEISHHNSTTTDTSAATNSAKLSLSPHDKRFRRYNQRLHDCGLNTGHKGASPHYEPCRTRHPPKRACLGHVTRTDPRTDATCLNGPDVTIRISALNCIKHNIPYSKAGSRTPHFF
ncbi:hypothetical protein AGLY_009986, partial [Aphis glycines]